MTKLRVFFDADAILAGCASASGAAHLLLQLCDLGLLGGVTSDQAREEARRNLIKKVPGALAEFETIIEQALETLPDPSPEEMANFRESAHPKDVPILAAAVLSGACWLVTFNLKDYYSPPAGIQVVEPGRAIRQIREALLQAADLPLGDT